MDPVFTLQWPEFLVAEYLQRNFSRKDGYCVLIPTSRQEKGIDLALIKKNRTGRTRIATIQVKASRTYLGKTPKKAETKRYLYRTWFNRFDVPHEADYVILVGMYAPNTGQTKRVSAKWYKACMLIFTNKEMNDFMNNCLTVKRTPDRMFAFAFDQPTQVFQTRGDSERNHKDFSSYLLDKRIDRIKKRLSFRRETS